MSSGIISIEDIIDDVKKNIKMVFQNGVRAEDRQEVYIIELEFAQNNYQDTSVSKVN